MAKTLTKMLLEQRATKITNKQIRRGLDLKTPSLNAVETGYKGHLLRVQAYINRETRELLRPPRKELIRTDSALEGLIQFAFDAIGEMATLVLESEFFNSGVLRAAERTSAVNFNKYDKNIYNQLGVNGLPTGIGQEIVNNWIKSNVNLITKTNANQRRALESLFRDNAYTGTRAKDLEAAIDKIFKGTRNNVKLIARDQVHKLNSQLDRAKQKNAGIPGYYWRVTRDERLRLKHAERSGKYFDWDKPPDGGHPGEEYQCRCTAEAAIDRALLSVKEWKHEQELRAPEEKRIRDQAIEKSKTKPVKRKKKRKG